MFGVDKDSLVLLGQVVPVASTHHALLDGPFATQVNEDGTAVRLELIVDQVTL